MLRKILHSHIILTTKFLLTMKKLSFFAFALLFAGAMACNNPETNDDDMEDGVEELGDDMDEMGDDMEEGIDEMGDDMEEGIDEMDDDSDELNEDDRM